MHSKRRNYISAAQKKSLFNYPESSVNINASSIDSSQERCTVEFMAGKCQRAQCIECGDLSGGLIRDAAGGCALFFEIVFRREGDLSGTQQRPWWWRRWISFAAVIELAKCVV